MAVTTSVPVRVSGIMPKGLHQYIFRKCASIYGDPALSRL